MGLFSQSVTQVNTIVQPVFEENIRMTTVADSVLKAVMRDESITDWILEDMLSRPKFKVERMYEYAKEEYTWGLPNVSVESVDSGKVEVHQILEALVGRPVELHYAKMVGRDFEHYTYERLQETYGYNAYTGELPVLSNDKGTRVYLDAIRIEVNREELTQAEYTFAQNFISAGSPKEGLYSIPNSLRGSSIVLRRREYIGEGEYINRYVLNSSALPLQAVIEYVWEEYSEGAQAMEMQKETVTWGYDPEERGRTYFQALASWEEETAPGRVEKRSYFWSYRRGDGTYPILDDLNSYDYANIGNTYLPFIFFVRGRTYRGKREFHNTNEYKTSKKMLEYLGLDYQALGDGIMENPDSGEIEQATLMFGLPLDPEEEHPAILGYFFEFWKDIEMRFPEATYRNFPKDVWNSNGMVIKNNALVFQDADFKVSLSYHSIERQYIKGNFGKRGSYRATKGTEVIPITYILRVSLGEGEVVNELRTANLDKPYISYQKQVGESLIEEIKITNPETRYHIWRNFVYIGRGGEETNLIPIDKRIVDQFRAEEQDHIYRRSMHFVFNARTTQKLKWYQTGFFKKLVIFAAIVITVYSGIDLYTATTAALAAGGIQAAAMVVLEALVLSQVLAYGFKLFVNMTGIELAFIAMIIAAAYAGHATLKAGSVEGAPWASELLSLVNGLGEGIKLHLKDAFGDLMDEWDLLREQMTEAESEIERALATLDNEILFDPLESMLSRPFSILGESAGSYYNRSVNWGNPGPLAFDAMRRYHDSALRLPNLEDTVGERV